jgi:CRISPR/Cas system endoribonuclease Cas6 (RAMP superfamily)
MVLHAKGELVGPKREEVQESVENCVLRRFMICVLENIISVIMEYGMGEACRTHVNKERRVPFSLSVRM